MFPASVEIQGVYHRAAAPASARESHCLKGVDFAQCLGVQLLCIDMVPKEGSQKVSTCLRSLLLMELFASDDGRDEKFG
jgi:hypothetical protein